MPATTKWGRGSTFIPARNSRHRTACLALYRALLGLSSKVPLPESLSTAWKGTQNPIALHIRRAFLRNRADTSPRLVGSAMTAGYRMLTTLDRAADTSTPEHTEVVQFLQDRLAEAERSRAAQVLHPPYSRNPRVSSGKDPRSVPLLVRTMRAPTAHNPAPRPMYESAHRPRPREALPPGGKRRIPKLEIAATHHAFLRLGKPQPHELSRVLTQKIRKVVQRSNIVTQWYEEGLSDASEEDGWEWRVASLLDEEILLRPGSKQEVAALSVWRRDPEEISRAQRCWWEMYRDAADTVADSVAVAVSKDEAPTYRRQLWVDGIGYLGSKLEQDRADGMARAEAMRRIIAEETALAAEERVQRQRERRARWEASMRKEHGQHWEAVVAEEKRLRGLRRAKWLAKPLEVRAREKERLRAEREQNPRQETTPRPVSKPGVNTSKLNS